MGAYELELDRADKLPLNIRFGSSTWAYPGWKGLIYNQVYKNEKDFKQNCLREYATCSLFRTVGIDSSFYNPLSQAQLERYSSMVPQNFTWTSKVWERITIPVYPKHARYGELAGTANPDFLNAKLFVDKVIDPCKSPTAKPHVGPFVFEFQTFSKSLLSELNFLERLRHFLKSLPDEFRYAVEIRTPSLLDSDYFGVLNEYGVTHCFNHWYIMPSLRNQMLMAAEAGGLKADFFVARILTPSGVKYEDAVKMFAPYETIKRPNPEMREDVVRLVKRTIERGSDAWLIVNNRAEGNSPMTIDSIVRMV